MGKIMCAHCCTTRVPVFDIGLRSKDSSEKNFGHIVHANIAARVCLILNTLVLQSTANHRSPQEGIHFSCSQLNHSPKHKRWINCFRNLNKPVIFRPTPHAAPAASPKIAAHFLRFAMNAMTRQGLRTQHTPS